MDFQVLTDSMRFRSRIADLGKFWHHLRDGYGRLIHVYCKLISNRLAFHQRVRSYSLTVCAILNVAILRILVFREVCSYRTVKSATWAAAM